MNPMVKATQCAPKRGRFCRKTSAHALFRLCFPLTLDRGRRKTQSDLKGRISGRPSSCCAYGDVAYPLSYRQLEDRCNARCIPSTVTKTQDVLTSFALSLGLPISLTLHATRFPASTDADIRAAGHIGRIVEDRITEHHHVAHTPPSSSTQILMAREMTDELGPRHVVRRALPGERYDAATGHCMKKTFFHTIFHVHNACGRNTSAGWA